MQGIDGRKILLEMSVYREDTIWDCEWEAVTEKLQNRKTTEEKVTKTTYTHT